MARLACPRRQDGGTSGSSILAAEALANIEASDYGLATYARGGDTPAVPARAMDRTFSAGPAMHPFIPHRPNPQQILSHSERLAREARGSTLELVFQGITAVSLGVMTAKMVFDMVHESAEKKRHAAKSQQGRER